MSNLPDPYGSWRYDQPAAAAEAIRPPSLTRQPSFSNLPRSRASYSPQAEKSYAYAFPPSRSMTRRMSGDMEASSFSPGNAGGAGFDPYGSPMRSSSPYISPLESAHREYGERSTSTLQRFGGEDEAVSATFSRSRRGSQEQSSISNTTVNSCTVCGDIKTAEWRKGPAGTRSVCNACGLQAAKRVLERNRQGQRHPLTVPEIEVELASIGRERFRPVDGVFTLPPNTPQRILNTIERTRRELEGKEAAKQLTYRTRAEKSAANSLLGLQKERSPSVGSSSSYSRRSSQDYVYPVDQSLSYNTLRSPIQTLAPTPSSRASFSSSYSSHYAQTSSRPPSPSTPSYRSDVIRRTTPSSPKMNVSYLTSGGGRYGDDTTQVPSLDINSWFDRGSTPSRTGSSASLSRRGSTANYRDVMDMQGGSQGSSASYGAGPRGRSFGSSQ